MMVDKPNTTPIGQDNCSRVFYVVYIPLFSLVQLGHPAITNIFVVNQIIRYNENGVFATLRGFLTHD